MKCIETVLGTFTLGLRPASNGAMRANASSVWHLRHLAPLPRICSLIPPAKQSLVRYFGVLGPAAKLRPLIVPHRNIDLGVTALPQPTSSRALGIDWASLLKRVYDIDVFECPCGGRMRVISVIEDPKTIKKILDHLHLPSEVPKIHPARAPPQQECFDECFDEPA